MVDSNKKRVKPRDHPTGYERTVVIGDIHGDLDILLQSLAAKKVLRYDGDIEVVLGFVRVALSRGFSKNLESLVVAQKPRLQLIFLGDLVDRWHQGCHVMQFLSKVRWQRFGIDAVFLLGNHDMLNLHFFVNPYRVHEIYAESEFKLSQRLDYIGRMGLGETLKGFLDLHRGEILAIQREFYRTGRLEWDLGYGQLTLTYNRDLSLLLGYRGSSWDDVKAYCDSRSRQLGFEPDPESRDLIGDLLNNLARAENPGGQNWWSIAPDVPRQRFDDGAYPRDLQRFNIFMIEESDDAAGWSWSHATRKYRQLLPVDWRVISLLWRRYYGDYFRRVDQVYRDQSTLYCHAGISPQALVDSQAFGVMFRFSENQFQELENDQHPQPYSIDHVIRRINRLTSQVMTNALNDYSFSSMSGAEITDLMGTWRGGEHGFTEFGGLYWADCDCIQHHLRSEPVKEIYRKFVETTSIRRIICGHTRFEDFQDSAKRYQLIEQLQELGLDFLSVDNSCSRGYRYDQPVLNGIEMGARGRIEDPGGFWRDW